MAKLFNNPESTVEVLNPEAFAVFQTIARQALAAGGHIVIDNTDGAYMPVHVEILGGHKSVLWHRRMVSVCHYGEQNGDAMKDPDMTFIWHDSAVGMTQDNFAVPCEFQNDYAGIYQQAIRFNEEYDLTGVRRKLCADLVEFCDLWMNNIKHQQGIKPEAAA